MSDSQPEPDVAIVRGGIRDHLTRRPTAGEVGLVVEIANTSLVRDLEDKARIYARAGVSEYWVVDVTDGCVEVFAQPSGPTPAPAYASRRTVRPPDAVPLALDGVLVAHVPVADLLP